ncbi:MAG: hypothetical protein KC643_25860 [Nitrospira sp.]|nr:hypothetical protein [Nitrospira sp.]MCB1714952.1 hypothetical protein [Candidatus Competibacteraceae bacterium]HQU27779.1 hypothetical protein [Nitrospirales bacterium]
MTFSIGQILLAGLVATIGWFLVGGALFGNPVVKRIYRSYEHTGILRDRGGVAQYLGLQLAGIALQCFLWAFVFAYLNSILPESRFLAGIFFGLILIVTKIIPRFWDMWVQSTYPVQLLSIEFINGALGTFLIGIIFAFVIR